MSRVRPTQQPIPCRLGILPIQRRAAVRTVFALLLVVAAGDLRAAEGEFFVVVRQDEQEGGLDRAFVADAFLKKRTRWSSGEVIHPVDQRRDAAVRHHFSRGVLKRSVDAVRSYWQQRIFSGRDVPPPEVDSDAQVIRYLKANPGSIGYVSAAPDTPGVQVVTLR
jgi:ABC-type phosphate transport system substrate-binding protein